MTGKLCFLCCRNFHLEVAAAVAAEGWNDVTVFPFTSRCGHPPLSWDELHPLVEKDCTQVVILGRSCLKGLGSPPADWPPVRQVQQHQRIQVLRPHLGVGLPGDRQMGVDVAVDVALAAHIDPSPQSERLPDRSA